MTYVYKTYCGTWIIRPAQDLRGKWELCWDAGDGCELSGFYAAPDTAAREVYAKKTGWISWDCLPTVPINMIDLANWEKRNQYP